MIGGEHYFLPPAFVKNSMAEMLKASVGKIAYFSSGRDALFSLLSTKHQQNILLPDLICSSVYDACKSAGKNIYFYEIDKNLTAKSLEITTNRKQTSILIMHYFGETSHALLAKARQLGLNIISDVTHGLFDENSLSVIATMSDYLFSSLRKSGPFPDGGFVASQSKVLPLPNKLPREDFVAFRIAGLFARGFSARDFFSNDENHELIKKAELILTNSQADFYSCSHISKQLLSCIDVKAAQSSIQRNQLKLKEKLYDLMIPHKKTTHSPYFCCFCKDKKQRNLIRNKLAENKFFCPIHWDTSWNNNPSFLSDIIFSIPCDARYNEHDMNAVAEKILICL